MISPLKGRIVGLWYTTVEMWYHTEGKDCGRSIYYNSWLYYEFYYNLSMKSRDRRECSHSRTTVDGKIKGKPHHIRYFPLSQSVYFECKGMFLWQIVPFYFIVLFFIKSHLPTRISWKWKFVNIVVKWLHFKIVCAVLGPSNQLSATIMASNINFIAFSYQILLRKHVFYV